MATPNEEERKQQDYDKELKEVQDRLTEHGKQHRQGTKYDKDVQRSAWQKIMDSITGGNKPKE